MEPQEKAAVAFISADRPLQVSFRDLMADVAPEAGTPMEVLTPLAQMTPEELLRIDYAQVGIVFVDTGSDPEKALELTRILVARRSDRPVALVGATTDPQLLLAGVRAGASEFIERPLDAEALKAALSRLAPRASAGAGAEARDGRVLSVLSGKGGTGVTTVATNLAVTLAEKTDLRTLLLDLDELGTAGLLLGLWPRYTFQDLVSNFHRMDVELLESMVEHHESGVDLLSSPLDQTEPITLSAEDAARLIEFVKMAYDYVVVDLGRSLSPWVDAVVAGSDDVLVVSTAEVTAVRNAKRALDRVKRSFKGMDSGIRVVVNQFTSGVNVRPGELRDALGHAVFKTLIREDEAALLAADTGRPVVLNTSSKFGRDLEAIGIDLAGDAVQNGVRPGGLKGRLSSLVRRKGKQPKQGKAKSPRSSE